MAAVACSPDVREEPAQIAAPSIEQAVLKGHAVFGHEVRSITLCGQEEPFWAIDSTGLLWELHRELDPSQEPYGALFVVVLGREGDALTEGFGADYSGTIVIDQVLYAANEGFDCGFDLTEFHFRAAGNEPFWNLTVRDDAIELTSMGEPRQTWSSVRLEPARDAVRYLAGGGSSDTVEVAILEEHCRDTMSGAFHGYRASIALGSDTLTGCALRGETTY
jgi:uncharacterized membrane protein